MTSLLVTMVLGMLQCGTLDKKAQPEYCRCSLEVRLNYNECVRNTRVNTQERTECHKYQQKEERWCQQFMKKKNS